MSPKQDFQQKGKMILIVDDDPQVLTMTSRVLTSAGYRTLEAREPAEALAIARQNKIDVLLVDAVLPAMSGPDLADELSKIQGLAKTVFMSGLDPLAVWVAFGKPCQVLQKPFFSEELIRKIELPAAAASAA